MSNFPGLRKAAIFLASMPDDRSTELLARLERHQANLLAKEVANLAAISPAERKAIFREFAAAIDPLLHQHHWSVSPPFSFLRHFDRPALTALLRDEHPQTVAVIVSYLAQRAVDYIAGLSAEQQADLIYRIATLGRVDRQIVNEVEIGLQARLVKSLQPGRTFGNAAA